MCPSKYPITRTVSFLHTILRSTGHCADGLDPALLVSSLRDVEARKAMECAFENMTRQQHSIDMNGLKALFLICLRFKNREMRLRMPFLEECASFEIMSAARSDSQV